MAELDVPSKTQLNTLRDYYHNSRYDDAQRLATSLTEQFPEHQFSWKILGALFRQKAMYAQSLLANQKAVELIPQDVSALNNLSLAFKELGRAEEAEGSLRQAITIQPDFAEAHSNLGITLKKMGRLKESEVSLRQAITLKPDLAEAHGSLGIIAYLNGDIDLALASIENASILNPNSKPTTFLLNVIKSRKLRQNSRFDVNNMDNPMGGEGSVISPLIFNRKVEDNLISTLYEMDSMELDQTKNNDARYGNGRCSPDFNFFEDNHRTIKAVSEDLTRIMTEAVKSEIYIYDSFFNVLGEGSGTTPHDHISVLDKELGLVNQKYSLVYYLSVGDQDCSEPGILTLYKPLKEIVPSEGMITIIPAARKHSAIYGGKKDRVMIGVNFYSL